MSFWVNVDLSRDILRSHRLEDDVPGGYHPARSFLTSFPCPSIFNLTTLTSRFHIQTILYATLTSHFHAHYALFSNIVLAAVDNDLQLECRNFRRQS